MASSPALGAPFVKRYFTRLEAARALGLTLSGWRKLERRALVVPVPLEEARGYQARVGAGRRPTRLIRAEDVARLRDSEHVKRMSDGQLAAAAFELFLAGRSVVDVVVKLKLPPERARELHASFCALRGFVVLPGHVVEELRGLGFAVEEATFVATVERLVAVVRQTRARRGGRAQP